MHWNPLQFCIAMIADLITMFIPVCGPAYNKNELNNFITMKKRIVFGVLVLSFFSSYCLAFNNQDISESVKESFCKEFVNAEAVHWENLAEYEKAHFTINGQILDAYFDTNGKLIAVTRNILSNQLPIHLFTTIVNEYSGYYITDLFEVSIDEGTSYYITLREGNRELVLRSEEGGSWEIFKSIKEKIGN